MSGSPLLHLFRASLSVRAGKPALTVGPAGGPCETLTFGEVDGRSAQMAAALAARALGPGDRLAVQLAEPRGGHRPLPGLPEAGRRLRAGQRPLPRA